MDFAGVYGAYHGGWCSRGRCLVTGGAQRPGARPERHRLLMMAERSTTA